jgi:beta-mannosidase
MALNWCFNEPWPTAAGNSIVNWPALPRPAYLAVKAACRPVLASARLAKFQWRAGEAFSAEIWMLNDGPADVPAGQVEVTLRAGGSSKTLLLWAHPTIAAGRNLAGPAVTSVLPSAGASEFELVLTAGPGNSWGSRYRLSLAPGASQARSTKGD